MDKRIYIIICGLLNLLPLAGKAQQETGLYFMPRAMQNIQVNPAFMQEKTVSIGLPSIYFHALHSGFSYRDLLREVPGTDSLEVDVAGAIASMREDNVVRTNVRADLLGVTVKVGPMQVSASAGTRITGFVAYPRSLAQLAWEGNAGFIDQEVSVAPEFAFSAWHEIGLGMTFRRGKFQAGIRGKYLVGLADFSVSRAEASLTTSDEIYQLQMQINYQLQSSVFDPGSLDNPDPQYEFRPFTGNNGIAGDFGLQYKMNDKLSFSASVIDLGFIKWKDQAAIHEATGTVSFEGLDVAEMLAQDSFDISLLADSLLAEIKMRSTDGTYQTDLPTRIYIGGTFSPIKSLRLGGVYYSEFYRGRIFNGLAVSASKDLGKILTAGITYSIQDRRFDNLGVNLLLKLGPVLLYSSTDHLSSFLRPGYSREVNARIGMNVVF
ncbi:MAG: DUF5723 family protein [Bacteroidia bacterium]